MRPYGAPPATHPASVRTTDSGYFFGRGPFCGAYFYCHQDPPVVRSGCQGGCMAWASIWRRPSIRVGPSFCAYHISDFSSQFAADKSGRARLHRPPSLRGFEDGGPAHLRDKKRPAPLLKKASTVTRRATKESAQERYDGPSRVRHRLGPGTGDRPAQDVSGRSEGAGEGAKNKHKQPDRCFRGGLQNNDRAVPPLPIGVTRPRLSRILRLLLTRAAGTFFSWVRVHELV